MIVDIAVAVKRCGVDDVMVEPSTRNHSKVIRIGAGRTAEL